MKNLVQYISACFFCAIIFSCSDNFLTRESYVTVTDASEILISPEWEAKDYYFYIPNTGNAMFYVVKTPDWLHVQTVSGRFENNIATIHCSASAQSNFSEIGIYKSFMLLDIEGTGNTQIPVAYINEGKPEISAETNLMLQYDNGYCSGHIPLVIKNEGQGILLWSIAEKPEWISIDGLDDIFHPLNQYEYMILPNEEAVLNLSYHIEFSLLNDSDEKIKIISNDKSNSETVINFQLDEENSY